MIYLDHNATTPLRPEVFATMAPVLRERWGNPSSPYRFGNQARAELERARDRLARCVGCQPKEILFCSSGTESDNLAVRGVAGALRSSGNHIVTTMIEHHAVLNTCKAMEEQGYRVTYLPVDENGVVDLEALAASLVGGTLLVSVMQANNETGVIQPIDEIAAMVHARGVLLHVDAVQTTGKLEMRLDELGADLVTFSAHKLYGPKGIAALVVRPGTPIRPVMTGGLQERGLRAGTENVAGIVGFAQAATLACAEVDSEGPRLRVLRDRLESEVLSKIPRVRINGSGAPRVPNTSNLTFQAVDGESIVLGLDLRGICVSTGSACSTGSPEASHVLRAMGLSAQEAQGTIRISLGKDTRDEDIAVTTEALEATIGRLRAISSVG